MRDFQDVRRLGGNEGRRPDVTRDLKFLVLTLSMLALIGWLASGLTREPPTPPPCVCMEQPPQPAKPAPTRSWPNGAFKPLSTQGLRP